MSYTYTSSYACSDCVGNVHAYGHCFRGKVEGEYTSEDFFKMYMIINFFVTLLIANWW